ncbi:hypothetical protein JL721_8705 [Aureococcus anophagefferens]|nr:hypothetical protein JL721_8705 [Aureococcus anophagefferens]
MEAWFKKGKETGRAQVLTFEFNAQALGMTVSDYGGEGDGSALVAGGEASAKGLLLNDRGAGSGGRDGRYRDRIAPSAHLARPLLVDVERRVATAQGDLGSGLGLFAGISIEGTVINERNSVNERHYAFRAPASQVLARRRAIAAGPRRAPVRAPRARRRCVNHDDLINEPVAPPMKLTTPTVSPPATCCLLHRVPRLTPAAALGAEFAKKIAAAGAPDALLWLTDASDAAFVARAAATLRRARRRRADGRAASLAVAASTTGRRT